MNFNYQIIYFVIGGIGFAFSIYYFYREQQEINYLKQTLNKLLGKEKITTKEDIVALKNFLNKAIGYDTQKKYHKRPLLRDTAENILKSAYGFCGENARVAIKLLLLSGIKARRIYLFRKEWQHVLVEHEFEGKWHMFDGHYDAETLLSDDQVAHIPSEQISAYPDNYPNNPYLDFCRIKLFYKISFLKGLSKVKLPSFIVYILESPYVIKGLIWMTIAVAGLLCSFASESNIL